MCCEGYVNLDEDMANVTAFEGQTVRLRCDVTGFPLPRYRWLLKGQPLLTDGSRRYEARTTVWGSLLVCCVLYRYMSNNNNNNNLHLLELQTYRYNHTVNIQQAATPQLMVRV